MTRRIFQYLSSATILLLMAVPGSAADAVRGPLGMAWWHTARMTMQSPAQSDVFGVDVGISGNWAIGGGWADDTTVADAGLAAFYGRWAAADAHRQVVHRSRSFTVTERQSADRSALADTEES